MEESRLVDVLLGYLGPSLHQPRERRQSSYDGGVDGPSHVPRLYDPEVVLVVFFAVEEVAQ